MPWRSSCSSAGGMPACLQGRLAGNRCGGSGGRWCPRQCAPNAPSAAAGVTAASAAAATLPPLPAAPHPCALHPSLTRPSARSPGGAAAAGHGAGAACGAAARGSRGGLCGLRAPLPGVPWRPVQVRVVCSFGCKPGRRLLIFPCCRHICPCTFMQQSFRSGCLSLLNMKHCAPVSLHLFRYQVNALPPAERSWEQCRHFYSLAARVHPEGEGEDRAFGLRRRRRLEEEGQAGGRRRGTGHFVHADTKWVANGGPACSAAFGPA